jgi:hypothetical protein
VDDDNNKLATSASGDSSGNIVAGKETLLPSVE